MRTRGENWKLRVPLIKPVAKSELEEVAGRFGLARVLAELKGRAAAQAVENAGEGSLAARVAGQSADKEAGSGKEKMGTQDEAGQEPVKGSGGVQVAGRLGEATRAARTNREGVAAP